MERQKLLFSSLQSILKVGCKVLKSTGKGEKNMSNEKVILAFLEGKNAHTPTRDIINGYYTYKGQTLKTEYNVMEVKKC